MNDPVTFSSCLLEPIVSTVTNFLSIHKGCRLYLDVGSRRERNLRSMYFLLFERYIRSVDSLLKEKE